MNFIRAVILILIALPMSAHATNVKDRLGSSQKIPIIHPLVATYEIYVGGLNLVTTNIFFEEEFGKYHATVKSHTAYGFWYKLFPWNNILDVRGLIKKDRFIPKEYYALDNWNNHPKETKIHYDNGGYTTTEFNPPNRDVNREIVTRDQSRHSYDPVTGLLQMLANVAVAGDCNITVPIFDGKRYFQITGTEERSENLDEADYSVFKGDARVCGAAFKMIAGEWKEKGRIQNGFWQRNNKEQGRDPFNIWLGSLGQGVPELPVRLQGPSVWGLIVTHLSSWVYVDAKTHSLEDIR